VVDLRGLAPPPSSHEAQALSTEAMAS
jgi:hypothetical protein